jgi:predicted TIM-barrel fold metal-dependent hydrolase
MEKTYRDPNCIIDAHCHIYPEKIAAKAVAGTDRFYDTTAAGLGTVTDLMIMGKEAGIGHFIVQSVATTAKQVRSINEFISASVASDPRLTGLGTMHPDCEDPKAEIDHLMELGLLGIKIHPDIQAFPIDDPRMMQTYALCEERGLPILMHTGDYRYDFSNPNRLIPVLEQFKNLTVIGAHMGGWSLWDKAYEALCDYPNLFVDCSSTMPFSSPETAKRLIRAYGAERVLFGTDYPMWSPANELTTFRSLGLTEEEERAILHDNAIRAFKLG